MKSEYAITRGKVRGSKRFGTDCALNRPHARLSVTMLPEKRHVSLTPTGKSAFLTHVQRRKPLLVGREDQGATACASPEESNEKRRFHLPISLCLYADHVTDVACFLILQSFYRYQFYPFKNFFHIKNLGIAHIFNVFEII